MLSYETGCSQQRSHKLHPAAVTRAPRLCLLIPVPVWDFGPWHETLAMEPMSWLGTRRWRLAVTLGFQCRYSKWALSTALAFFFFF